MRVVLEWETNPSLPNRLLNAMKKTPYELIVSRLFTIGKRRAFKETLLPLLIGISLGYLIGSIISFEDIDSIDHVMKIERHAPESTLFFLRCLIMIHPEAKKAANFVAAIRDTYGKVCNQTIYFTHSKELQRKVADQFFVVVDTPLNAFHWNYYKDALVTTSEVPAHWTYIGDEQGILVIGNLRKLVRSYNHRNAIMFGRIFTQKHVTIFILPNFTFFFLENGFELHRPVPFGA
ncbi:hypothetical protein DICVIV_01314 [Dictyocaulus viviparus]|uniref:Uncharacterized protein n=1 Tax=Dictyocaulus viviparus TaxID=29172 RepID=A0A0D8Y8Z6_DICVI|nr:hypothetical protein DICVIV_01314 [Dictyocaulus viviparus]